MSDTSNISTHLIFGKNLRILCARIGTIAEVADRLDVNRVQMNRILNGESFPKPGLLRRICDLFNVDARIILQPLEEIETEAEKLQQGVLTIREAVEYAFFEHDFTIPSQQTDSESGYRLPDCIHIILRPSFTDPAKFLSLLVRVFDVGGRRVIKG